MLETLLLVFLGVWVVGLSIWIILDRRPPTATLGWIFALAFLPYVGIPVYLLIGPRKWSRKKKHLDRARAEVARWLGGPLIRASLDVEEALSEERAQLVTLGNRTGNAAAARAREVTLYHEGIDFYAALEESLRAAKRYIHLEFYIWDRGRIGTRLRDLLVEKAREGVEVRLLLDAVGSPQFGRRFARPLVEAGGEFVLFNRPRFFRIRPQLVNFRTHRKIVIVDGDIAFTGGMNIKDYHTSEFAGDSARRDTDLKIRGLAANWLHLVFLENWVFASGVEAKFSGYLALEDTGGDQLVQIAASGPEDASNAIHRIYFAAIGAARKRVLMTSAYFVPDEPIVMALQAAALRGVDVRVLVPEKCDQRLVRAASRTYYDELIRAGVKIYEYQPRMHHGKTMVVDHDLCIVGTANVDNRSFRLNFEDIAVLYGTEPAAELAEHFEADQGDSREVEEGEEDRRAIATRILNGVARLFSPLL